MLPGAVLCRTLVDLGARVVKIEDPTSGDPMRSTPPLVNGLGAGFSAFFRSVESVCLNLRSPAGGKALFHLARHADILVESFRPGTMERWGLGHERLSALNPVLITCSLPSFASKGPLASQPGHDLNLAAASGVLSLLPGGGVPGIQLSDIPTGILAATSLLAALLLRHKTGRGMHLEQPLSEGPAPFLTWAWAETAAGGGGVLETLLSGRCPAYRLYTASDGRSVAVGALEPKFWTELVGALGLPHLAGDGLDTGERGEAATRELADRLLHEPSSHWVELATRKGLPLSRVSTPAETLREPIPPFLSSWAEGRPSRPAPALGEGTDRVLAEFGFSSREADELEQARI